MDWDKESVLRLEQMMGERWFRFKNEHKTDRKNLSELWNLHVKNIGITCLRSKKKGKEDKNPNHNDLIEAINFRNREVADALCVRNPDRIGQYLFVPRETASKILMLGMP